MQSEAEETKLDTLNARMRSLEANLSQATTEFEMIKGLLSEAIQSERDRIVRKLEEDKYKVTADSNERYYNDALDKAISIVKGGDK